MRPTLETRCRALVAELNLGKPQDVAEVTPLRGGVASDIARVVLRERRLCMKFALPRLKVQADWYAPLHRNKAEYLWLEFAADVVPESIPTLFGRSDDLHGFAMEYIDEGEAYLWKAALLTGAKPAGEAIRVAELLGRIHSASANSETCQVRFQNQDDFDALRLDPYLRFTAERHPSVAGSLNAMAECLRDFNTVLIHGDVSPKNILIRGGKPVLLDAECATTGDASFDIAFCLNHLVLKAFHLPDTRDRLFVEASSFWRAYAQHVDWECTDALERRTSTLLPMLMLARIDGKSPVEYLAGATADRIRETALRLIATPIASIDELLTEIGHTCNEPVR